LYPKAKEDLALLDNIEYVPYLLEIKWTEKEVGSQFHKVIQKEHKDGQTENNNLCFIRNISSGPQVRLVLNGAKK
jgi:hypothetical protein